jgi:hypothetical protein
MQPMIPKKCVKCHLEFDKFRPRRVVAPGTVMWGMCGKCKEAHRLEGKTQECANGGVESCAICQRSARLQAAIDAAEMPTLSVEEMRAKVRADRDYGRSPAFVKWCSVHAAEVLIEGTLGTVPTEEVL